MRSLIIAGIFVSALTAMPTAGSAAQPAVYRGTVKGAAAEQLVATRYGVAEIRGTTAMAEPVPTSSTRSQVAAPYVVGGERLWRYDPTSGDITVCRLSHGAVTGRARIMCESGYM